MVANVRVAPFPHTCLLTVAGIAAVGFSQRQSQNRVASTYPAANAVAAYVRGRDFSTETVQVIGDRQKFAC